MNETNHIMEKIVFGGCRVGGGDTIKIGIWVEGLGDWIGGKVWADGGGRGGCRMHE